MKVTHDIFGVPGTLETIAFSTHSTFCKQEWVSDRRKGRSEELGDILMHAKIRFDDSCLNGYHSFAITGYGWYDRYGKDWDWDFGGCCHDEIAEVFPELAPLIKWHRMNSCGPTHYLANTIYHSSQGDFDAARCAAIWPEATDEQLTQPELLEARLPELTKEFRATIEAIGFQFDL